jgi:hypothetical protein
MDLRGYDVNVKLSTANCMIVNGNQFICEEYILLMVHTRKGIVCFNLGRGVDSVAR